MGARASGAILTSMPCWFSTDWPSPGSSPVKFYCDVTDSQASTLNQLWLVGRDDTSTSDQLSFWYRWVTEESSFDCWLAKAPGIGTSILGHAIGGDGDDVIYGSKDVSDTTYHDLLDGNAGDDHIYGYEGNDTIYGGAGADTIHAGEGDDVVSGDDGNDAIDGGDNADTLYGGPGGDLVCGGGGDNDLMYGNAGEDRLYDQTGAGDAADGGVDLDYCNADVVVSCWGPIVPAPTCPTEEYLY